MKQKKYQLTIHSFLDFHKIEQHLERMAQKGWMLEAITPYFWIYQRIEAQNIPFTITYFPNTFHKKAIPSEEQFDFQAYCEEAGWKFVAQSSNMLVFAGNTEDPLPIDTDDEVTLHAIHQIMHKRQLSSIWAFILIPLLAWLLAILYKTEYAANLSSTAQLLKYSYFPILLLIVLAEVLSYHFWYRKARKQVANHQPLPAYPSIAFLIRNGCLIVIAILVPFIMLHIPSSAVIILVVTIPLITFIHMKSNAKFVSGQISGSDRGHYALINALLSAIFISVMSTPAKNDSFYEVEGSILPISTEQLYESEANLYELSHQSSPILSYYQVYQKQLIGYGLFYDAFELHMPQFKNIIKKDLLVCSPKATCVYTELDSTIWNIEAIYRNGNTYVFVSGNRMLKIYFPIYPTDEQIMLVVSSIKNTDWFQEHKNS